MKSHYPQHLHNTHLIPPIAKREKGLKPQSFKSIRNKQVAILSDGFRDKMNDGQWKTTHPVYLVKKWVEGGSKKGKY